MRCTRRLLDRYSSASLLVVGCLATAGAASSCSSEGAGHAEPDAAAEASSAPDAAAPLDADLPPDASPPRDAAFDGGPLPVVCATPPCAKSLVTTLGATESDLAEGFCALLDDGTVACWGANQAGQLGRGDAVDSAKVERVAGLSDIVQIDHTCALDASGGIWCWGTVPYVRDGDAGAIATERTPVKLPIPPATRVAVGSDAACAVVDGGVVCWGRNTFAQLAPLDEAPATALSGPRSIALPAGAPVRDLVVGSAAFVLRADGEVVSWGATPPLGRVSSLFPDPDPMPIALRELSSLDVSRSNACATAGGIGHCWGPAMRQSYDPFGVVPRVGALPTPVVTPEPIVRIATTAMTIIRGYGDPIVAPSRWCAVSATGTVYCWGHNAGGQAGDGTKDHAYEAVQVKGLPEPAADVKTTPNATCALLTNGKVHCWGTNFYGQLGYGRLKEPSLEPREVVLP